jgi:hypothetical protein
VCLGAQFTTSAAAAVTVAGQKTSNCLMKTVPPSVVLAHWLEFFSQCEFWQLHKISARKISF